jgi:hypothetical protein
MKVTLSNCSTHGNSTTFECFLCGKTYFLESKSCNGVICCYCQGLLENRNSISNYLKKVKMIHQDIIDSTSDRRKRRRARELRNQDVAFELAQFKLLDRRLKEIEEMNNE